MSRRSPIAAVQWVLAGSVVQRVAGFIGVAVIARLLVTTDDGAGIMGAFEQLVALHLILAVLLPFGFDQLVVREANRRSEYAQGLRGAVTILWVAGVVLVLAGMPWLAGALALGDRAALLWGFPLVFAFQAMKWAVRPLLAAELAFRRISAAEAMNMISFVVSATLLLWLHPEAISLYAAYAVGEFVELLLLWRGRDAGSMARVRENAGVFRELLAKHRKFCGVMAVDQGVNSISNRLPALLLGGLIGPFAVGLYGLANRLVAAPAFLLMNAVGKVTLPVLAGLPEDELKRRTLLVLRTTSVVIPPILIWVAVFASPLTGLALGEEWRDGVAPLAQVLALNVLFQVLFSPISVLDVLRDRPEVTLYWNLATVTVRAIAIVLAAPYGVVTALMAYAIVSVVMWNIYGLVLGGLLRDGQWRFARAWMAAVPLWLLYGGALAGVSMIPGLHPVAAVFVGMALYAPLVGGWIAADPILRPLALRVLRREG